MRNRKRGALPPNHEYCNFKYDAAFQVGVMSDDEDEDTESGKKTNCFISRQLSCASDEVRHIYSVFDRVESDKNSQLRNIWLVIDALEDPEPSTTYATRIQGPDKELAPRIRIKLAGRLRWWMIKPEWLADLANAQYDIPKRIAPSGKGWGDEVDPEDDELAKKELKVMAVMNVGLGKRKQGTKGVGGKKKKAKTAQPTAESQETGDQAAP